MDNKKSLLESLKELTPNFKYSSEADEVEKMSVKDIIEEPEEVEELGGEEIGDEEHSEHEEEDENGKDADEDGDMDNITALEKLKDAFESSPEEMQHALIMFTRIMIDSEADIDDLKQFVDDVDLEDEDSEDSDEEDSDEEEDNTEGEFGDDDDMYGVEDEYDEKSDDEEDSNESVSDDEDEYDEFKNNLYESEVFEASRDTYFTNEAIMSDEYDIFDMLD